VELSEAIWIYLDLSGDICSYLEIPALRNPMGAKMAPKSTKWCQNGIQTSKMHSPFFGPGLLMHGGRPLGPKMAPK